MGLRGDIHKGVGVTTTINSKTAGINALVKPDCRLKRGGSERMLKPSESQRELKDDSSGEFLPVQKNTADWAVRKTTEVRTSEERQAGRAATGSEGKQYD